MAYDDLNLLASVTDPMGGVTSYTWDDNRRPSTVMDAEGDTTSFSYDAAGRLVEKALPGDLVTFTWDDGDNLVAVSDSDSSVTFAHDHLGQPLESTQTIDGFGSETLTWTWDLRGLPTSMTGPAGTIAYSWDASGRPRSIDSVISPSDLAAVAPPLRPAQRSRPVASSGRSCRRSSGRWATTSTPTTR